MSEDPGGDGPCGGGGSGLAGDAHRSSRSPAGLACAVLGGLTGDPEAWSQGSRGGGRRPPTGRHVWKPLLLPSLSQVPCYAFDRELKKHDLNPLIKTSGAYLVDDSDPDTSLFINVCRDIGVCLRALGVGVGGRISSEASVRLPWPRRVPVALGGPGTPLTSFRAPASQPLLGRDQGQSQRSAAPSSLPGWAESSSCCPLSEWALACPGSQDVILLVLVSKFLLLFIGDFKKI